MRNDSPVTNPPMQDEVLILGFSAPEWLGLAVFAAAAAYAYRAYLQNSISAAGAVLATGILFAVLVAQAKSAAGVAALLIFLAAVAYAYRDYRHRSDVVRAIIVVGFGFFIALIAYVVADLVDLPVLLGRYV